MKEGDYIRVKKHRGRYKVHRVYKRDTDPRPGWQGVVHCYDHSGKSRFFPIEDCSVDRKKTRTMNG